MNNNALIALVLAVTLSAAHGGLLGPLVLQGPSSKTTLVGPDGSHITGVFPGGSVVVPGAGLVGAGAGLVGLVGSGHEGQYVHDYSEQLYDDGSYKGDYYEGH